MKNTEATTGGNITKPFARIRRDKENLKNILICPAFSMDQRMAIKKHIIDIEDATTGITTKQGHTREIYAELKATKTYADDEKKLKRLLTETQDIVAKAELEEITLSGVVPVAVSDALAKHEFESENHRTAWMAIYYDLEGEYLI